MNKKDKQEKRISPKEYGEKLNNALFEQMQRNPEWEDNHLKSLYGETFKTLCKELDMTEEEIEKCLKSSMSPPAALNLNDLLSISWVKAVIKGKGPLEDIYPQWWEKTIEDAKFILNALVFPSPDQFLITAIDLDKPKNVILAELDKIITKEREKYQRDMNREFVIVEDLVVEQEKDIKNTRDKWLSINEELLQVWDLYGEAGKTPAAQSFESIAKKVGRPVSTVKDQWRLAHKRIYGKAYDPESKYTTSEKLANADSLCSQCLYGAKCYRNGDWYPCSEYLKIAGKERNIKAVEYKEEVLYTE